MLIESLSSSTIVLVAVLLVTFGSKTAEPDVIAVKVIITVSLPSTIASSRTGTVITVDICPAIIVAVSLKGEKSTVEVAVPLTL